jgi:excisionase family DNA binding protein
MQERLLSVEQIATHLGVHRDTTYKLITRARMPAHKLGRLREIPSSEVDEWIKGGHAAEDAAAGLPISATSQEPPTRRNKEA